MQVRKIGVAGFATKANHLPLFYAISHFYKQALVSQVPVTGPGAIAVLNHNKISIRPVFRISATSFPIAFSTHNHAIPYCTNACALPHFKIKCCPVFVCIMAEIALHQQVCLIFPVRELIYKTAVVVKLSFLQQLQFFSLRVVAYCTCCKTNDAGRKQEKSG